MRKPKITFVLPVRNCEAFVAETIRGLIQQSLKDIEIIIFEDCSDDDSLSIIQHYARDKRISVHINKKQMGAAWCRNTGNQLAKADIICVADAGDIYHCDRAKETYKHFKKFKDMDIFSTGVEIIDITGRHLKHEFPKTLTLNQKPCVSHPTVAYRTTVADKIKYRELSVHTDLYESFLLEATIAGFQHGFKHSVYVKKRMMTEIEGQRNIVEAWKQKKKGYIEFGIELPKFLNCDLDKLDWKQITNYRY